MSSPAPLPPRTALLALLAAGGVALAVGLTLPGSEATADTVPPGVDALQGSSSTEAARVGAEPSPAEAAQLVGVALPTCEAPAEVSASGSTTTSQRVDPRTRAAAQEGLDFLSQAATSWQGRHGCYGCHVQAVTAEALAVGLHNDYRVEDPALEAMIAGLTTIDGGTRSQGGLQYHGGTLLLPSKAFGGAALARYDALVGDLLTDDLLAVAAELEGYQADDGAVRDPGHWVNLPVGQGELQFTWQAIATWRQAFERSADPRWLTAVAQAEDWLHGQVASAAADPQLQPTSYVLLGLADAGASLSEAAVQALLADLLERQHPSGGWALTRGGSPDAFATGQALVTLRTAGLGDGHPVVDAGTAWLLGQQLEDGSWGHGGDEKAKAMWAVLGLVSVDTVHIELTGLQDGAHLDGPAEVRVAVSSNEGRGIRDVRLAVDDVVVAASCGGELRHRLDPAVLGTGPRVVDVLATDADGRTARRRLEVYAGAWFLVDAGTAWDDGGTLISLRNLAPAEDGATVQLQVRPLVEEAGEEPVPGEVIATRTVDAGQGALRFWWDGAELAGRELPPDTRFRATLSLLDPSGQPRHSTTADFVHADPQAVASWYGQVGGQVDLPDERGAANTWVELVDQAGNVLDRVRTTKEGRYRFKDVKSGEYNVRVEKAGYGSAQAPVTASPDAEAEQDLGL